MMAAKKVRAMFCPQCRSFNVRYTFGLGNLFGVIPKQQCGDCKFSSQFFPILETTEQALRKKTKHTGKKK